MAAEELRGEAVAGRLFSAGARTFVLSLPLPSSLPIPLHAITAGLDLAAWAFAGLAPDDAQGPRALLVLIARDETVARSLREGARIGLALHYRDVTVAPTAAAPLAELPADDRAVLARAVLSAAAPAAIDALADLAGLIEASGIAPEADAPEIALTGEACRVPGSRVPDYLLLRSGADWACLRVARARLAFGAEPHMALTLEPVWGPTVTAPEAAILIEPHRFVPARIGTA